MNTNFEHEGVESAYLIYLDRRDDSASASGFSDRPGRPDESVEAEYVYLNPADVRPLERGEATIALEPPATTPMTDAAASRFAANSLTEELPKPEIVPPAAAQPPTTGRPQYEGFTISHYQVERAIGRGGMGDVYLARDLRLGRPVALKLLRADYQATEERVRRFQHEARAVCALNHPNIVTIYEVGEVDGAPFIVSEFIEGDTLRQLIPPAGMRLDQALEIAIQIGNALVAAHQLGVVHRDIKPENVMVRSDGYVKVLDFGLAKLSDALDDQAEEDPSMGPGVVMGTITYMSPEQARGFKVDARSDVFSLGIVLHELVTGQKPFEGRTPSEILSAILTREAPPIASYKPDETQGIQHVIAKALQKDRDERYSSMIDMIRDLRELKNEVALQSLQGRKVALPDRPLEMGSQAVPVYPRVEEPAEIPSNTSWPEHIAALSVEEEPAVSIIEPPGIEPMEIEPAASLEPAEEIARALAAARVAAPAAVRKKFKSGAGKSGERASNQPLRYWPAVKEAPARSRRQGKPRSRKIVVAACAIGLLLAVASIAPRLFRHEPLSFDRVRLAKVTSAGRIVQTTISPDGRYIAYTQSEAGGKLGLWLRRIETPNGVMVVPPRDTAYPGFSFSRDGAYLYYLSREAQSSALYRMATQGGPLEKLPVRLEGAEGAFALSADGRWVAMIRGEQGGETALVVADLNTGEERKVVSRQEPAGFRSSGLAWSPDGEHIACPATKADEQGTPSEGLLAINLKDGKSDWLSAGPWQSIDQLVWLQDGGGMLVAGRPFQDAANQLWHLPAKGEPRRVTGGPHHYAGVSLTADARAIATVQVEETPGAPGTQVSDVVVIHRR